MAKAPAQTLMQISSAKRSGIRVHVNRTYDCIVLLFLRSFFNPQPSIRIVMDGVSNLVSGLNATLKSGATRKCKFSIKFR